MQCDTKAPGRERKPTFDEVLGSMEDKPYGMARLLALSSQVVRGTVGLSAIVPAWQRLGHEVIAVPTVILSRSSGSGPQNRRDFGSLQPTSMPS